MMQNHQVGQTMSDMVPDWVPQDLQTDWAEKYAICLDAGLRPSQAAKQADATILRAISYREARHG